MNSSHVDHHELATVRALEKETYSQLREDKVLDLSSFAGDATVTLSPWPLIAKNQRYWIRAKGTLESGEPYSFFVAQAKPVTVIQEQTGISETLRRSELEMLANNSALTVTCQVAFDGVPNEEQAVIFPELYLLFKKRPAEEYDDLRDQPFRNQIPIGNTIKLKFMTLTIAGTSTHYECQLLDNNPRFDGHSFNFHNLSPTTARIGGMFELAHPAQSIEFRLWGRAQIIVMDETDAVTWQGDHGAEGQLISARFNPERAIKKIEMYDSGLRGWSVQCGEFRVTY